MSFPRTQELLDHSTPNSVVRRSRHAPNSRNPAVRCQHAVSTAILFILSEQRLERTDCRCAEAYQGRRIVIGEPLEISAHSPCLRGNRQRIGRGAREMVETDRAEPVRTKISEAMLRHGKPGGPVRHGAAIHCALPRYHVRHMRIAKQCNSVSSERNSALQSSEQIISGLLGQAVNQVEVERLHTGIA